MVWTSGGGQWVSRRRTKTDEVHADSVSRKAYIYNSLGTSVATLKVRRHKENEVQIYEGPGNEQLFYGRI
jgi:hypothetical protein